MKKMVAFIFSVIFASSLFAETFDSVCENLSKHPIMTGRFSQVKTISSVNRQMKSNGTFIFSLDGIMWKTEKPFASSMVVGMTSVVQTLANGKQTVIDASSNQIFTSISTTLSAMFGGNAETLRANFDVDFDVKDNLWNAKLNPKNNDVAKILKSLEISGNIAADSADLNKIVMSEANGDKIEYTFTEQKYPKELTVDEKAYFTAK